MKHAFTLSKEENARTLSALQQEGRDREEILSLVSSELKTFREAVRGAVGVMRRKVHRKANKSKMHDEVKKHNSEREGGHGGNDGQEETKGEEEDGEEVEEVDDGALADSLNAAASDLSEELSSLYRRYDEQCAKGWNLGERGEKSEREIRGGRGQDIRALKESSDVQKELRESEESLQRVDVLVSSFLETHAADVPPGLGPLPSEESYSGERERKEQGERGQQEEGELPGEGDWQVNIFVSTVSVAR